MAREYARDRTPSPLRMARLQRGLSIAELAELAGLTKAHLSRLELEQFTPQRRTRAALATALRCDPDSLFDGRDGASDVGNGAALPP
jgi:transcriptional regulator with XRE-family HTH domain